MHRLIPALALLAVLSTAAALRAQEENPIAAKVRASVDDPAKPFTMFVRLKVKQGQGESLEKAFAPALKATRKEKGNRAYQLNRSAENPRVYVLYERWENLPALEEHLKSGHITELLGRVDPLLDGAPEVQVFVPAD